MAMTLITTNTSSNAASSSFTSSIDNTYKLYIFKFIDVNPVTDAAYFMFNGSIDAGSNYNATKTTTFVEAWHSEADDASGLGYSASHDEAQSADPQYISGALGNDADESAVGELYLFNPSSTTYVKHFHSRVGHNWSSPGSQDILVGGYFNTTSDIDAVQFSMSSGNMDAVIKMYGVG